MNIFLYTFISLCGYSKVLYFCTFAKSIANIFISFQNKVANKRLLINSVHPLYNLHHKNQ